MPIDPIQVALTDGEKIEVLKRFQQQYIEEMAEIEVKLTEILRQHAEADFVIQYLGEQPEVKALKDNQEEVNTLEQRRQHLAAILERLEQVVPKQAEVSLTLNPAKKSRY